MRENTCAFTGHRELGGDFDRALLERVVERLARSGMKTFLCGMARGFDLVAAEIVLKFKVKYGLSLVACIPYEGQADYFSSSDRERYENILKFCDEKRVFAEKYNRYCMFTRDRNMVENCYVMVCYLRKRSGGTYYTVNCAKKSGGKTIEVSTWMESKAE